MFTITYVSGFSSAEMRPTNVCAPYSRCVSPENAATCPSSFKNARSTRTPARFSRTRSVTPSSRSCTRR